MYLLFELSRVYPPLVATVIDTDGQFVLIEAAHQLPKWLKPETAENRVRADGVPVHTEGLR